MAIRMTFDQDQVEALMAGTASEELVAEFNEAKEYKAKKVKLDKAIEAVKVNVNAFITKSLVPIKIPEGVKKIELPYRIEDNVFCVMSSGIAIEYSTGTPVSVELAGIVGRCDMVLADAKTSKPIKDTVASILEYLDTDSLANIRTRTAFYQGPVGKLEAAYTNSSAATFTAGMDDLPDDTGSLVIKWNAEKIHTESSEKNGDGKTVFTHEYKPGWLSADPILGKSPAQAKRTTGNGTKKIMVPKPEGFKSWIAWAESVKDSDEPVAAILKKNEGKKHGTQWSLTPALGPHGIKHPVYMEKYNSVH